MIWWKRRPIFLYSKTHCPVFAAIIYSSFTNIDLRAITFWFIFQHTIRQWLFRMKRGCLALYTRSQYIRISFFHSHIFSLRNLIPIIGIVFAVKLFSKMALPKSRNTTVFFRKSYYLPHLVFFADDRWVITREKRIKPQIFMIVCMCG